MARVLPKIEELTFKKEELDQLDVIIGSIPATYATAIIDMFRIVNQKRLQEIKIAQIELINKNS